MLRTLLAAIILTLLPSSAQAYAYMLQNEAHCLLPSDLHHQLIQQKLFLFTYGITNDGFLISIYVNPDSGFVVVAESGEIACILTDGTTLYTSKTKGI